MHETSPLVCICIPTFNAGKTIHETLASILGQTYQNLIVRVVDNASTDNTLSIVRQFDDPRVSIFENEVNIGGEANFTRCIDLMTGQYSAIFHADDLYTSGILSEQVEFLDNNPTVGAVFTNATLVNESGVTIGAHGLPGPAESADYSYDFWTIFKLILRYGNFLICPSALVRTEIYRKEIREWRGSKYRTSADLDVWLRILFSHRVGVLPGRLIRYRLSSDQGSFAQRARTDRADIFLVLDDYLSRSEVKAMLTSRDLRNYDRLQRTDLVVRVVNLYLAGQSVQARRLLKGAFSLDALLAAGSGFKGLATLAAGLLISLLIRLGDPSFGRPLVQWFRSRTNK